MRRRLLQREAQPSIRAAAQAQQHRSGALNAVASPEAIATPNILHDDVQVVVALEAVVESDDKWVVCCRQYVALILHALHHVLAHQVHLAHDLQEGRVVGGSGVGSGGGQATIKVGSAP